MKLFFSSLVNKIQFHLLFGCCFRHFSVTRIFDFGVLCMYGIMCVRNIKVVRSALCILQFDKFITIMSRTTEKEPRKKTIRYLWRVEYISYRQMESVHCFIGRKQQKKKTICIALRNCTLFHGAACSFFSLSRLYYKFISTDIRKTIFQK